MINVIAKENNLTGKIELFYAGSELYYQKLIVNAETCSQLVFNELSNPLLFDFLGGVSKIELDLKSAGVFDVKFFFLEQFYRPQLTIEHNLIQCMGVYMDFLTFDGVYCGNEYYDIIQSRSTDSELFLDRPLQSTDILYKCKRFNLTVTNLIPIKTHIVNQVLGYTSVREQKSIKEKLNLIELIELEPDIANKKTLYKDLVS